MDKAYSSFLCAKLVGQVHEQKGRGVVKLHICVDIIFKGLFDLFIKILQFVCIGKIFTQI